MKLENQQLPIISPINFDKLHASKANISGIWVESTGDVHLEGAVIK
jgi:hypothetical protein